MLVFDGGIPGGNLAAPECEVRQEHCIARFAASPHGGLERLWFHFELRNPGDCVLPPDTLLVLKNIDSMLGAELGRFRPVIRRGAGEWERLPAGRLAERGDGCRSLEWRIATPAPESPVRIAFCFPYEAAQFKQVVTDCAGFWRCDEIGVSAAGRPFFRLSNSYGSVADRKPGLYLTARQHAAETSGAWVLDGVLRRLAQRRIDFPVWCVPFANLDGVEEGDYGKNPFPWDLNRAWGPKAPMRHETLLMRGDLTRWKNRVVPECSGVFDFHSPGADELGVYCFHQPEMPHEWRIVTMLPHLAGMLGAFSREPFLNVSKHKAWGAWAEHWNLTEFAVNSLKVPAASFEISYFEAAGRVLTVADYRMIGECWADWAIAYLQG